MKREGSGGELLIFFCFVSAALLGLACCARAVVPEQGQRELLACLLLGLLLSAAHCGSCWAHVLLPLGTALMGAVSACAAYACALGLRQGDKSWACIIALLLAAVPLHFLAAVQSMAMSQRLIRARRQLGRGLGLPDIMSWASMAALAVTVSLVLLR